MPHCRSKTKSGAPCRAPAGQNGLCFFHAHPELSHSLGRVGGTKNRSKVLETRLLEPLSAESLRDILSEAICDVRTKRMSPRVAGALAQLCNSMYRVLQAADLESRLGRIEQQLAEQGRRESVKPDASSSTAGNTAEQQTGTEAEDRLPIEGEQDDDSPKGGSSQ